MTRIHGNFFRVFSKNDIHPGKLYCTFVTREIARSSVLLNEVKPSPDRKIMTRLIFDDLFPSPRLSS